jgi:hypothetical protein
MMAALNKPVGFYECMGELNVTISTYSVTNSSGESVAITTGDSTAITLSNGSGASATAGKS